MKLEILLEKQILMNRIASLLKEKDDLEKKLDICIASSSLLRKYPDKYFQIQRSLKKLDNLLK